MADDATEHLRMLTADDLERVIEIDRTITGRSRRGFFEKRLEAAEQPNTCPHGRPTMIHMSETAMAREFQRT